MLRKKPECGLQVIASTERGRILQCVGHPGYILEFGPVVIRLREAEFQGIADSLDQLGDDFACAECGNAECRGGNFALEISRPRMTIEFFGEELGPLRELLVEARLSILLLQNRIVRP